MFGHPSHIIAVFLAAEAILALAVARFLSRRQQPVSEKSDGPPSPHPCQNSHDLIPIDAQILFTEMMPFPQTVVLKRCRRCAFHASIGYAGKWTIADFLKEKSDVEVLEGMIR